MSLKTTRGVTWENQILWSPAHCEAVVTCGLQSRSLVTAVSTDVRQEKTNIMKLANEVLPEFPDPFFLSPVSRVATWVCDLSCQDFLSPSWSQCLLSCWPGTNLHTQLPAHWRQERRQTLVTRASSGPVTRSFLNTFHWANRVLNWQIYWLVINYVNVNHYLFMFLCVYCTESL